MDSITRPDSAPGFSPGVRGGWALLCVSLAVLVGCAFPVAAQVEGHPTMYLSDMARDNGIVWEQAWGSLGIDTATVPPDGRAATPLVIGETTYARGLGHHAAGTITVAISPHHVRFLAEAGVQWQGGQHGSVVMQVWVDGEKRFESPVLSDSSPAVPIDVSVAGGREMRLVATDNGDGISCDMATWAEARFVLDEKAPILGKAQVVADGTPLERTDAVCGFSVAAGESGPQFAFLHDAATAVVCLETGEECALEIPLSTTEPLAISAQVLVRSGADVTAAVTCGEHTTHEVLEAGRLACLTLDVAAAGPGSVLRFSIVSRQGPAVCTWSDLRAQSADGTAWPLSPVPSAPKRGIGPVPSMPVLRPGLEQDLLEWDWRMHDGIGTPRQPVSWATATGRVLEHGLALARHLEASGVSVQRWTDQGMALQGEVGTRAGLETSDALWEDLWRRAHHWRRELMLEGAWPVRAPIAFVKRVPSCFSHQLTQYYGACARPGGGIFVLDRPGDSLRCRPLAADLPAGSFQHLDVRSDAQRLVFAFCPVDTAPANRELHPERVYHLYETGVDGGGVRQLTEAPFDDFSPRYLPEGGLVFLSTRRGGYHRCGRGPCPVYTLARADADGQNVRTVSFHETNEWDPAVMADGRIVYTRWDYVDRSAVYYQQLWSVRPDGSDVRILYGNNTFNPVGVWESRAIPGSRRLMATAAAHHAMTAGSIILLDPAVDVDGLDPITRLTPDALFPESEVAVGPTNWNAPAAGSDPVSVPEEAARWPGHCYRSPFPLAEHLFLVAYSFDPLQGEPVANHANMFGLYLADRFGNRELLHRDLNISSLWPALIAPRTAAPAIPSMAEDFHTEGDAAVGETASGRFFMANVYSSYPALPDGKITHLRILQVLPKSTPHANTPRVGWANASPGKQVLGTVPVETDGSAWFEAPARIPLMFQALDEKGRAVQTMRSLTYLQPGETSSCIGCHEPRLMAPQQSSRPPLALSRAPSAIAAGPDGSCPLSYPLLVQPVLDRLCVRCHNADKAGGDVRLTGEPDAGFSVSYNALARRVPYSEWQGGDFRVTNDEPLTHPDRFGARVSPLLDALLKGHHEVDLSADDLSRLITWMDANALFYGTFNPADQERQLRGEPIAGPDVE